MIKQKKNLISEHFKENYIYYVFVLAALLMGIILGAASAKGLDSEKIITSKEYVEGTLSPFIDDKPDILNFFKTSIRSNFVWGLLTWIFGMTTVLIPFIGLIIGGRGFAFGFSVAFLVKAYSFKGLSVALGFILPQCLLSIPIMAVIGASGIKHGVRCRKIKNKKDLFLSYLVFLIVAILFIVVASVLESTISWALIDICCLS